MKKKLQTLIIVLFVAKLTYGQDTLFYENFESGSNSFTLNTTDVSSTATGYNYWVVNNEYTGGSGSITCLGIPLTFNVINTNAQPGAFTGGPNSFYMHTVSDAAINSGINCCCFLAADGLCNNAQRYFSKMTSDINTSGYDTVSLGFWWLCKGGNNSYGEVYYSIDSGTSWTLITIPFQKYNNHPNWSQQALTLPALAGQNTLRFGFRFVNQVATAASDPGFGLDEVTVTGKVNAVIPLVNFIASDTAFCESSCINFSDLSSNAPMSWQWSFPGGTPDSSTDQNPSQVCYAIPGSYDVTLIAANANGSDTLTLPNYITIYPNPVPPVITISNDTLCSTPAYSYQWYSDTILISGATNQCYYAGQIGNYSVLITDSLGCTSTSNSINTGIEQWSNNDRIIIYPNPSNGIFNLIVQNNFIERTELIISDVTGRVIFKKTVDDTNRNSNIKIDLTKNSDTVYFLTLKSATAIKIKRLLLNK